MFISIKAGYNNVDINNYCNYSPIISIANVTFKMITVNLLHILLYYFIAYIRFFRNIKSKTLAFDMYIVDVVNITIFVIILMNKPIQLLHLCNNCE